MIVVVMGVSGAGKTVVGRRLALDLGWTFIEGDEFHPAANVDKMSRGIALDDADRLPWLDSLHNRLAELARSGRSAIVACSALRQSYRDRLSAGVKHVRFVYLKGEPEVIAEGLRTRRDHFMRPDLLASQFEALEEPEGALWLDAALPVDEIVTRARAGLEI